MSTLRPPSAVAARHSCWTIADLGGKSTVARPRYDSNYTGYDTRRSVHASLTSSQITCFTPLTSREPPRVSRSASEPLHRLSLLQSDPLFLSSYANSRHESQYQTKLQDSQPKLRAVLDREDFLDRIPSMIGVGVTVKPPPTVDDDDDATPRARPSTAPTKPNVVPKEGCTVHVVSLLYGRMAFYIPTLLGYRAPPPPAPRTVDAAADDDDQDARATASASSRLRIADMKRIIYERVRLSPSFRIELYLHGLPLNDHLSLMDELRLAKDTTFDMKLTRVAPWLLLSRGLGRVRVNCPLLHTRAFPVDETTTVLDLKRAYCAALEEGDHTWFTADGVCVRRTGTTVLTLAKAKADPKAGTSALVAADELLIEGGMGALAGGQGAALAYRIANGSPVMVVESQVVPLSEEVMVPETKVLKEETVETTMWINWGGRTLGDDFVLHAVGVRTDDTVTLEFLSPVLPKKLLTLRLPDKPKKGGKGKKKK